VQSQKAKETGSETEYRVLQSRGRVRVPEKTEYRGGKRQRGGQS
jgi:hypothetical protein